MSVSETHPIRCCADGNPGNADWERKYSGTCPSDVWGASDIGGICSGDVTYSEGKQICEDAGGRLCTIEEIDSDCARGTGCNYDHQMVWTATSAPPPPYAYLTCGSSHSSICKNTPDTPVSVSETHPLRCCADGNPGNADWERKYPGTCPSDVWGASDIGGVGSDYCRGDVTYSEGKQICEDAGGRLCTIEEIDSDCARGTGCNYDNQMVWTASMAS